MDARGKSTRCTPPNVAQVAETILGCAARFCNSPHLPHFAFASHARQKLPCRAKRWPANAFRIGCGLARGSLKQPVTAA